MASETERPKLELVAEQLDADEAEFNAMRVDLPGAKGAAAAGVVAVSVGKIPQKNEFFRTHREFRAIVPIVNIEVGMEKQFFAVTKDMITPLHGIGIDVSEYALYLTVTSRGAVRVVPVGQAAADGEQNEYNRTKEMGLMQAVDEWVRLFHDSENKCYKVFPAPVGRFADAVWPEIKSAKIYRMAFRDKGRLLDSPQHPLFLKWAARD